MLTRKGINMRKSKLFRGVATMAAAMTLFVSLSFNSFAMSEPAQNQCRPLTADEVSVISRIFDAKWYAKDNPDVVKIYGESEEALLNHFVSFGIWEQRQPAVDFNVDVYATRNPDLQREFGDDIIGYYLHYAYFPAERQSRTIPTLADAYYHDTDVYSVYDFVKGQTGPKKGAVPVSTRNYHPDLILKEDNPGPQTEAEYYASLSFAERAQIFK